MIVGETLFAIHTETSTTPFTLAPSAVTVSIKAPDGTTVTPSAGVSVVPGTSSTVQTISVPFTATMGGIYRVEWDITVSASLLKRVEFYLATWTNAYRYAALRMNEEGDNLTQDAFDMVASNILRQIVTRWPTANYALLVDPDQQFFDEAMALMSAYRLYPSLRPGGLNGPEVSRKQGDTDYRWAQPRQTITDRKTKFLTERDKWLEEATQALARVTPIKAVQSAQLNAFDPFIITGRQKQLRAIGMTQDLSGTVRDLCTAPYDYYERFSDRSTGTLL